MRVGAGWVPGRVALQPPTLAHGAPHTVALQEEWRGVDMSAETELLWPGAALLLLLGVVASLCVRCSRPGKGGIRSGRGSWVQWKRRW